MNLFETSGCLFAIGGTAAGIVIGADSFGWIGSGVGGTIGFFGGWFVGLGLVAGYFAVGIFLERRTQRRQLRPHFGEYYSKSKTNAWELLKGQRKIPDSVTGTVLTGYHYGVFVDVGCGFPCLLTKLHSADAEDDLTAGATISAHIYDFDDNDHIVELSQGNVEQTLKFAEALGRPTRHGRRAESPSA